MKLSGIARVADFASRRQGLVAGLARRGSHHRESRAIRRGAELVVHPVLARPRAGVGEQRLDAGEHRVLPPLAGRPASPRAPPGRAARVPWVRRRGAPRSAVHGAGRDRAPGRRAHRTRMRRCRPTPRRAPPPPCRPTWTTAAAKRCSGSFTFDSRSVTRGGRGRSRPASCSPGSRSAGPRPPSSGGRSARSRSGGRGP